MPDDKAFDAWWVAGGGGTCGRDDCQRAWHAATERAARVAEKHCCNNPDCGDGDFNNCNDSIAAAIRGGKE